MIQRYAEHVLCTELFEQAVADRTRELENARDSLEIALDEKARTGYTTAFDNYSKGLNDLANRSGGRYVGLSTSTQLDDAIFGALMRSGGVE